MQFKLRITRPVIDLRGLEDAVRAVDPAALLDLDPAGVHLRVATTLGPEELCRRLTWAGCAVSPAELQGVPSECCGGCGG
jgi:hypothetical protein